MTITEQNKIHLKLKASVAEFSQVFNTTFVEYKCLINNYTNHVCFASTTEVFIPVSLHTAIIGILGLEQVLTFKPNYREVKNLNRASSSYSYFLGSQAAQVYGAPLSTGAGIKVGIVSLGGYFKQTDLNTFFSSNNLGTAPTINIAYVDGGVQNTGDIGSSGENYLDIEIISSVVPQAIITIYFAPNTNQAFYDVLTAAIQNNNIVSCSWGSIENVYPTSNLQMFQTLFSTYSNVPVFIATGDHGSYSTTSSSIGGTGFPASCPNAIGNKKFNFLYM